MLRAVLMASVVLGAWGCIPAGGGGGGDDEDGGVTIDGAVDPDDGIAPDRGIDPDDGIAPDRGVDPDDGITPDRGVDPDDGIDPDRGVDPDDGIDPDEGVEPDQGGGMCVEGRVENRPCGLNGRGQATRVCADGRWSPWGCDDPDVCVDETAEARPCAGGEERRRCDAGQWSAWGACRPPPVCDEGDRETRGCGLNGRGEETRICGDGQWGPWGMCLDDDVCTDGARQQEGCGLNNRGVRARSCVAGQWGAFGQCDDPDVCVDGTGEPRACGLNGRGEQTRRCMAGRWGAYGACADPDECRDGAEETRACGLNGRGDAARVCAEGDWGPYGACDDPDECVDGAVIAEPCPAGGDGQRVCEGGQFGERLGCAGDVLCPAPPVQVGVPVEGVTEGENRAGGSCAQGGRGPEASFAFTAPAAGIYRFSTDGSVFDTVLYVRRDCADGATELGCNDDGGEGTRSQLDVQLARGQTVTAFVDGYYTAGDDRSGGAYVLTVTDISGCAEGEQQERPCLDGNGVEQRTCVDFEWGPWSACLCDAGDDFERVCGLNDRGTQAFVCVGGEFPANPPCDDPDECVDGSVEALACPAGTGVREGQCVEGAYDFGLCADPVCPPGEVAVLGEQVGQTVAGVSQLTGSCGTSGTSTEQTWSFTADEAGPYTFDTSGSGYDTVLYLRRACGNAATEIGCNDDGGEGSASRLTVELAAGETVTVVVDGYSGRVGDYRLAIGRGDLAICVEDDYEPNDALATARELIQDFFSEVWRIEAAVCDDNADFWSVPADANCEVTADLELLAGALPTLALYGPDRALVEVAEPGGASVSGTSAQAGTWWLRVEPEGGEAHYELVATVTCEPPAE